MDKSTVEDIIKNNALRYKIDSPDKMLVYFYTAAGTFRANHNNIKFEESFIKLINTKQLICGSNGATYDSPAPALEYSNITAISFGKAPTLGF